MKEYRVLICFLPFLASVWFLGPFWNFFSKFSKKDHFQKMNLEKLFLLFNLVSLDLSKIINVPDSPALLFFGLIKFFVLNCTFLGILDVFTNSIWRLLRISKTLILFKTKVSWVNATFGQTNSEHLAFWGMVWALTSKWTPKDTVWAVIFDHISSYCTHR